MSPKGNSSHGYPSAHRSGCQAQLGTLALGLHLVPRWVQRASPASVWHGECCWKDWGDPVKTDIGLPEMCLRQMLESLVIYGTGSKGQGCR